MKTPEQHILKAFHLMRSRKSNPMPPPKNITSQHSRKKNSQHSRKTKTNTHE
jgi:hypothetical protein